MTMRIVIAGGTGFLGRALTSALASSGHTVVLLSRRATAEAVATGTSTAIWTPNGEAGAWASVLDGADALVNLAGEPIAGHRWTPARKQHILESRVLATRSLVRAIADAATPPPVFISGSAVGYYGACGDEVVTEQTEAGRDFLAGVCVEWEAEAMRAASSRTRVACIRTGLVLARDGGALPKMLPPFRFGAGGPIGTGRQYWPWIHRRDWVDLVRFAIDSAALSGPVNATAPAPVPNARFARSLGRAMHRPAWLTTPAFAMTLLLGEMAEGLLLSGQRALPAKTDAAGFAFRYATLDAALADLFARPREGSISPSG